MIEHCSGEGTGRMTDTAILIGQRMELCFTCGEFTIMTRRAVIHDPDMVKRCGQEARGHVALTAITDGRHMEGGFACCGTTVTRSTVIHNTLVIKVGAGKGRGVVAHGAILRRGNMIWRHAGGRTTVT